MRICFRVGRVHVPLHCGRGWSAKTKFSERVTAGDYVSGDMALGGTDERLGAVEGSRMVRSVWFVEEVEERGGRQEKRLICGQRPPAADGGWSRAGGGGQSPPSKPDRTCKAPIVRSMGCAPRCVVLPAHVSLTQLISG